LDGNQLTLLLTGEDFRYLSARTVDHEDLVVVQGEFRRFTENDWQLAFGLEGLYLDQVIDLSVTETNRNPILVRGGTLTGRPGVRRDLSEKIWLTLELPATRQFYTGSLDDYWELGPKILLGRSSGSNCELSASYEFTYRDYDTEPARDAEAMIIPGRVRAVSNHDVVLGWKQHWDARRRWRTTTKLGYRRSLDNASGYFDYERYQASQQLRYRTRTLELTGEVRFAYYQFSVQTIGGPESSKRQRTDLVISLRAERELARHVRLFAQYEHEHTYSNLAPDEYSVNTTSGGVSFEF
jgi:hypothetical protein